MRAVHHRVVLDTNALVALLFEKKPEHQDAKQAMGRLLVAQGAEPAPQTDPLFIVPSLVVYEVCRGLLKIKAEKDLLRFGQFLRQYADVSPFDENTAEVAAVLWSRRAAAGQPAGELDLLIAATAVVEDCDVVTYDKGFPTEPDFRILTWADVQVE